MMESASVNYPAIARSHGTPFGTCRRTLGRAFTLLELVIVLVIVAAVASMVLPSLSDDRQLRLIAASSLIISDLEMAQVMTISKPEEAVVVRFDVDGGRYWLAYAATPDTPLTREDTGEPYLVELGVGRASGAAGVSISLTDMDDGTLEFDSQGGLTELGVSPQIRISIEGIAVDLTVLSTTGTVTESEVVASGELEGMDGGDAEIMAASSPPLEAASSSALQTGGSGGGSAGAGGQSAPMQGAARTTAR
jgi:prepilin-type N-terminal cleavage/methylation domain-containing protein